MTGPGNTDAPVGGRGKVLERARARELRAQGWTLAAIARELGASKGSVSVWARGVAFDAPPSRTGPRRRAPNALERRKVDEIATLLDAGRERVGPLSDRDLLIAGTALYAGEGSKTDGVVRFANTDPRMVALFCRWLRRFFEIDEARLRVWVYLHEGLDLEPRRRSGRTSRMWLQHSFGSRTGPSPTPRSAQRSTPTAAPTCPMRAPERTAQ